MLLLFAIVLDVAATDDRPKQAQAMATIRVERPAIANETEWRQPSTVSRREIIRRDERGQLMLLRITEFE
jgi:hypothetical protein